MRRIIWILVYTIVLLWSAIHPKDYYVWILEVFPALVAALLLIMTARRFPLTALTYVLILIHCVILMIGGHYTYAEVPLFDWARDVFGWSRNNYDKVGHLAQGFIPAIVTREILIRLAVVRTTGWLFFIVVSICLAISAFYELIEWWVAALSGTAADAFLGMQGYVWDTQSDMNYALMGSIAALLLLARWHNRQLFLLEKQPLIK